MTDIEQAIREVLSRKTGYTGTYAGEIVADIVEAVTALPGGDDDSFGLTTGQETRADALNAAARIIGGACTNYTLLETPELVAATEALWLRLADVGAEYIAAGAVPPATMAGYDNSAEPVQVDDDGRNTPSRCDERAQWTRDIAGTLRKLTAVGKVYQPGLRYAAAWLVGDPTAPDMPDREWERELLADIEADDWRKRALAAEAELERIRSGRFRDDQVQVSGVERGPDGTWQDKSTAQFVEGADGVLRPVLFDGAAADVLYRDTDPQHLTGEAAPADITVTDRTT